MKATKLPKIGAENYLEFIEDTLVDWFFDKITLTELEKRFGVPCSYYDIIIDYKHKYENLPDEDAKDRLYREELIWWAIGYLTVCVDRYIRDYYWML